MATEDEFLFHKNKNVSFNNCHTDTGVQYSDLNLNKNLKCSNLFPIQSNRKSYIDKKIVSERYEGNEKSQTWKKSPKIDLCSNGLSFNDENKKCWKKNDSSNATNNSTLSFHISAYENSNKASSDSFNKNFQKSLLIQKQKQISPASTFVSQNPFEFQRQQNDKVSEPEVSQFKASQRLRNPDANAMAKLQLDNLIDRLLSVGLVTGQPLTKCVTEDEIMLLLKTVRAAFLAQSILIEVEPPIKVCGDIHGQYNDLLRLFHRCGFPPDSNYLFLGDYVDRGKQNLETICLLFCYKVKYPENFFLLRGNHECAAINRAYGFYGECNRRYSVRLWQIFQDVFNCLPLSALVAGKIFCMHGGLSPQLTNWNQIRKIKRPIDPPNPSISIDLLWADPDKWVKGWQTNTRGVSYIFGEDIVASFCKTMDIDLVARAHQVVQDGYEFFANRKLVTIFSAPHYCGEFDNAAGVMTVDETLVCSFDVLRATHTPIKMVQK